MRRIISLAATGAAVAISAAPAAAQLSCAVAPTSCSVTNTVRAQVATVAQLTQNVAVTDFGTIVAADYAAGFKELPGALALTVSSNKQWTITAEPTTEFWSGGDNDKSPGDLLLNGRPMVWGTPDAGVVPAGIPGVTGPLAVDVRSLWSYANDPPGIYGITVRFTLSAP
jgi:hypothetical protein